MSQLAEQFDDLQQQRHASELGMWTFLATEILFFGGLFTAYTLYRLNFPKDFTEASHHLYTSIGAINTAILLISSLTMALAVHAAGDSVNSDRQRRALTWLLVATALLGCAFLALKGVEYYLDFDEHLVPLIDFHYKGPASAAHVELFMLLYFIMTGIHALHMLIGIGLVCTLIGMNRRSYFKTHTTTPVEMIGLYWHFVDIIWIFLLPLLYLI